MATRISYAWTNQPTAWILKGLSRWELIRSIGDGNRTVLLSSHLLHEVEQVCDSVTIISKGKLVAEGEVAELVSSVRGEQVRVKTTDDVRAREILSALD